MTTYVGDTELLLVDHDLRLANRVSVGQILHVSMKSTTPHVHCTYPARIAELSCTANCLLVERLFSAEDLHHLGLASDQTPDDATMATASYVGKSLPFAVELAWLRGPLLPPVAHPLVVFEVKAAQPVSSAKVAKAPTTTGRPVRKRKRAVSKTHSSRDDAYEQEEQQRQKEEESKFRDEQNFVVDLAIAEDFAEVQRIVNAEDNEVFWYKDDQNELWLADPTEDTKVKVVVGALLWVHKKFNGKMDLYPAILEKVISTKDPAGDSKISFVYQYRRKDLLAVGFQASDLDMYAILMAGSNYENTANLSEVAELDRFPPEPTFYYDTSMHTLSGFVDGLSVVLTPVQPAKPRSHQKGQKREPRLTKANTLGSQALIWAKMEPEQEHTTDFYQKIISELQFFTEFGHAVNTPTMLQRLYMIPHKDAKERGLAPTELQEWHVLRHDGPIIQGECAACGQSKPLSMMLIRVRTSCSFSSSSRREKFLIGGDCASKLECLLPCCKTLCDVRSLALKRRPPMKEIERSLKKMFRLISNNRSGKEDLGLL
jgi:hypothetical protein